MSLIDLKAIQVDYEAMYFGHSDKFIAKAVLDAVIDTLEKHEADIANRMLCTKYKAP